MKIDKITNSDLWISYPVNYNMGRLYDACQVLKERILANKNPRHQSLIIHVRGSSGIILGTTLISMLKEHYGRIELSIIRKPQEDCHGDSFLARTVYYFQKIIVDDTMETGNTVNSIIKRILDSDANISDLQLYIVGTLNPDLIVPKYQKHISLICASQIIV